jgi:hypothetical protein
MTERSSTDTRWRTTRCPSLNPRRRLPRAEQPPTGFELLIGDLAAVAPRPEDLETEVRSRRCDGPAITRAIRVIAQKRAKTTPKDNVRPAIQPKRYSTMVGSLLRRGPRGGAADPVYEELHDQVPVPKMLT